MAEYKIVLNGEVNAESVNKSIKQIESQIKPLKIKTSEASTKIKASGQILTGVTGLSGKSAKESAEFFKQFDQASASIDNFNTKLQVLKTSSKITEENFNSFSERAQGLFDSFKNGDIALSEYNSGIKGLNNSLAKANAEFVRSEKQAKALAKSQEQAAKEAEKQAKADLKLANLKKKVATSAEDFQVKLNNLKTTGGLTENQFNEFSNKLADLDSKFKNGNLSIEEFNDGIHLLKNEVSEASTSTKAMGQSLTDVIGKFTKWYLISGLVTGAIGLIKQMVAEVINLDKAMVELNKVFNGTEEDLQKVKDRAFELGNELGRTGEEVINATTEFKRMGYTIDESLELARVATMMTNVAEGITDTGEAATILTSILKGTGVSAEYAESLLDRLNKVSNENAVSFDALANMLQESAATMHILGNNTDETIGLLTGAFGILQDERVAKGIQTIGLRIAGLNEDMETEAGLANEVSEALMKYAGIDVFDEQTGQLKSTYAIMEELAGVWDTLSKNEQSVLLNQLAGKQRADVAAAILTNWEEVSRAVEDASNSMGSATEEQEKYVDSIEGRINQIKSTLQELADDVIGSDLIKTVLDLVKSIATLVAPVLRVVSALFKLVGLKQRLQRLGETIEWIGEIVDKIALVIEKIAEGIQWLWEKLTDNEFVDSIKNLFGGIGTKEINDVADSYKDLAETFDNSAKKTDAYTKALSLLKGTLSDLSKEAQSYLDKLDTQNEKQKREKELNEKLLSLEKARQELAEAKAKRVRIYRAGIGFTYAEDAEDVQQAQENLQSALNELSEYRYEMALDRAKDFISQLNSLLTDGSILEGWDSLFTEYSDLLDSEFGEYLEKANEFVKKFNETTKGLTPGLQPEEPEPKQRDEREGEHGKSGVVKSEYAGIVPGYDKSGKWSWKELAKDLFIPGYGLSKLFKKNASGTENFSGGATSINEHGGEIVNLPQGTEILSHNRSMKLTSIVDNPFKYLNGTSKNISMQFNGPLNFPNVTNADDASGFVSELISLGVANQANVK